MHLWVLLQVRLLGKHIGKDNDEIERVIQRPTYFNPYEAVDFGIIDRVGTPHAAACRVSNRGQFSYGLVKLNLYPDIAGTGA